MSNAHELRTQTITGTRDGPHLLILGGVHGDEFESISAIHRLMTHVTPEGLSGRVTFIPVVNESAFWAGQRCGTDGLDLARTCPGREDGSVTEQVAYAVSEWIRSADYLVDLHSGGVIMDVSPLVGYALVADPSTLDTQRRMAQAFNLPIIWGTSAQLDGRTLSVARDANVPSIYAEWHGGGICDPQGVEAYVEGCLNVMHELEMRTHKRAPAVPRVTVEDDRPQSGHLQINHPAPADGFFELAVALDEAVERGDRLGDIRDVRGKTLATIAAEQTGRLLCVRCYPRVREGDACAVILEKT